MKVIIPVAGSGTRLRPHTLTQPKVLMNVAGHPMIYHIVNQIIKDKIASSIVMITGNMGEQIEQYLNSTFKFKFEFIKQNKPLGLGHAIHCAEPAFSKDEEVLIILGDTLFDVDLKKMCRNKLSVIGVKKVEDPRRFGVIEKNKKGLITRFVEKPATQKVSPSNDAIVGLYYLKSSISLFKSLDNIIKKDIKSKGEYQLTDALEDMIKNKIRMTTYTVDGWLDCGKPETLLETNSYLLNKQKKNYKIPGSIIKPPVFIGKNTEIDECIIGSNVTIGDNCIIKNCIIENSIIDSNNTIENVMLKDTIMGKNCKVIQKKMTYNLGEYSEKIQQ
ncbi:MAG: NTP transferase domain-containing protein [Ignavibacteriae bacterium]|nr:NTP transferase domain-containing protein [Ignavibacteriota bacterium]